jgi:hypothetical protein
MRGPKARLQVLFVTWSAVFRWLIPCCPLPAGFQFFADHQQYFGAALISIMGKMLGDSATAILIQATLKV